MPKLSASPVPMPHAKALTAVAEVAGAALHTYLDSCLPALLSSLYLEAELAEADGKPYDVELREALLEAANAVALAVEEDGMHFLVAVLSGACASKASAHVRVGGAALLETLCKESAVDLAEYQHSFLSMAISMLSAPSPPVLRAGYAALDTLVKQCPKERYPLLVPTVREQLRAVADEHRERALAAGAPRGEPALLPGLCLPKGLAPLQAVYLQVCNPSSPSAHPSAHPSLHASARLSARPPHAPLHLLCTSSAPPLHLLCTSSAPPLHLLCASSAPPLHLLCTPSAPLGRA
jgi:hypothetical protein